MTGTPVVNSFKVSGGAGGTPQAVRHFDRVNANWRANIRNLIKLIEERPYIQEETGCRSQRTVAQGKEGFCIYMCESVGIPVAKICNV